MFVQCVRSIVVPGTLPSHDSEGQAGELSP